MQKSDDLIFLDAWHNTMVILAIAMVAIAIIIYLVYKLRVAMIADLKARYDYVNSYEIKRLKLVFYFFGFAAAMAINLYGRNDVNDLGVWFFVRIFFGISGATLVAYIASLILDFYYPTRLNYTLRKLRYTPRINPTTGNKMRLLSEDEEDVHLDEGMQAEENIFSIDYDVWMDEKSGELKIEKYLGHLTALQCQNCGFHTMKVFMEEIIERNEDGSPKELLKHYKCSYCKNLRATQFNVSRKGAEDYKHQKPKHKRNTKSIDLVKIDLHSTLGAKKSFEFSTVEEAQKFLGEFDFDKIN
jgi:hypothetical protein